MKKTLTTLLFTIAISITSFAQQGINYKALVKDGSGNLVANQEIDVKFSIIEDTGSTVVYTEDHDNIMTDANGIVITNIGEGTSADDFSTIDWGSDTHSLKTEIDLDDDTIYEDLGTTQFKSVPYAMHAKTAESVTGTPTDNLHRFNNVISLIAPLDINSTWTIPDEITLIYVELIGGGGGASLNGGGGGGFFRSFYATVSPGDILNYTVGSGGTYATGTGPGSSGNTTTVIINSTTFTAPGGVGSGGGTSGVPGSGGYSATNASSSYSAYGQSGTTNKIHYSYGPNGASVLTTEYGMGGGTYPHYVKNEGGFRSEIPSLSSTLRNVGAPYPTTYGSGGSADFSLGLENKGEKGVVRIYY